MEISALVGGLGPRTPGSAGGARQGSALHDSHKSSSPLLCTSRKPPGQRQQLRSGRGASAPPICLSHPCCMNTLQGKAWAKPVTLHPSCRAAQGRNVRDPAGGGGTHPHGQGHTVEPVPTARDLPPQPGTQLSPRPGTSPRAQGALRPHSWAPPLHSRAAPAPCRGSHPRGQCPSPRITRGPLRPRAEGPARPHGLGPSAPPRRPPAAPPLSLCPRAPPEAPRGCRAPGWAGEASPSPSGAP